MTLTIGSRCLQDHHRIVLPVFAEFGITVADGTVWLSIAQGLLIGAVCLLFGVWVARWVGLLRRRRACRRDARRRASPRACSS